MGDEEFVVRCRQVIREHLGRTQADYYWSVEKLNALYDVAATEFQRTCVRTAHNRLWTPEVKTLICLFDDLG